MKFKLIVMALGAIIWYQYPALPIGVQIPLIAVTSVLVLSWIFHMRLKARMKAMDTVQSFTVRAREKHNEYLKAQAQEEADKKARAEELEKAKVVRIPHIVATEKEESMISEAV